MHLCVSVSVTTPVGAASPLKAKVRYQQKALYVGNKITWESMVLIGREGGGGTEN